MSFGMRKSGSNSKNSVPDGGKQSGVSSSVFLHSNSPSKFFFNDRQVGSSSNLVDAGGNTHGTSHEGRRRQPSGSPAATRREEAPGSLNETAHVVRQDETGELPASLKTSGFNPTPAADTSHLDPNGRREKAQTRADQRAARTDTLRAHAREGYADATSRNTGDTGAGAARSTTYGGRGGRANTRVVHGKGSDKDTMGATGRVESHPAINFAGPIGRARRDKIAKKYVPSGASNSDVESFSSCLAISIGENRRNICISYDQRLGAGKGPLGDLYLVSILGANARKSVPGAGIIRDENKIFDPGGSAHN
jgi:hypothetical protein